MQESVSRPTVFFFFHKSSSLLNVKTSFIAAETRMRKSAGPKERTRACSWTARPGGVSYFHDASVPIGAWPPIRGTDLSCHLIALLLQTPPSSRGDDVQHHHLRRSCTRRDPNFFDPIRRAVSSALIFFSNAQQSLIHASSAYIITYVRGYACYTTAYAFLTIASVIARENLENFSIRIFFFYVKDPNYFDGYV